MKLADYIKHLQDLQEKYPGLDIEVTRPHPRTRTDAGLYLIPAKSPVVWSAKSMHPTSAWYVRTRRCLIHPRNRKAPVPTALSSCTI
jgi:hypothetical protein